MLTISAYCKVFCRSGRFEHTNLVHSCYGDDFPFHLKRIDLASKYDSFGSMLNISSHLRCKTLILALAPENSTIQSEIE